VSKLSKGEGSGFQEGEKTRLLSEAGSRHDKIEVLYRTRERNSHEESWGKEREGGFFFFLEGASDLFPGGGSAQVMPYG